MVCFCSAQNSITKIYLKDIVFLLILICKNSAHTQRLNVHMYFTYVETHSIEELIECIYRVF